MFDMNERKNTQMAIGNWRWPQHPRHRPEGFDLQTRFCKICYDVLCRQAGWLAGCCLWVLGYYNCFNLFIGVCYFVC